MAIDKLILGQFLIDLEKLKTLEARFECYETYIKQLGFDGATYSFAPRLHWELFQELPIIFLCTSDYPKSFLVQYEAERLDRHDFTIRKGLEGLKQPMDWRKHELTGDLTANELGVIRIARECHGIKNGLTIPVLFTQKACAGVSLISYRDDEAYQVLINEHLEMVVHLSKLFHNQNYADGTLPYKFVLPLLKQLSPCERDVLRYMASGRPLKSIHTHIDIGYNYATNVTAELRRRFGKTNNARLMYLFGLIDCLSLPNPDNLLDQM